jgi:ABC-type tungstate transport system substrate-binding protein
MAALAWAMMGIAIWHFTIFLPDRFWAGIVGAFVGAVIGAVVIGFVINGFSIPSREDTHLIQAFIGIPGAAIGLGVVYLIGSRQPDLADA